MKLTQTITFASVKLYCLITLICLIILISHIVQLVLILEFIVSVQVHIFPLNMCDTIIYVARWWEKDLSKRSLIKHTCSWRVSYYIMNTEQTSENIFTYTMFPFSIQTKPRLTKNWISIIRTFSLKSSFSKYHVIFLLFCCQICL